MSESSVPSNPPPNPPPSPENSNLVTLLREVRRDIDDAADRIPLGCYRSEEYNELADAFGQLSDQLRRRALLRLVSEVGSR